MRAAAATVRIATGGGATCAADAAAGGGTACAAAAAAGGGAACAAAAAAIPRLARRASSGISGAGGRAAFLGDQLVVRRR